MSEYATFPKLSRQPVVKGGKSQYAKDPTLRDDLENGMEATRAKFTRFRRQYSVIYENLTNRDIARLRRFVEEDAVGGANIFWFTDTTDKKNPVQLMVRFSVLPVDEELGWVVDQLRFKTSFELRAV